MNENRELSSNPYGDEQQVPYESWEEKKTPSQETQASTPPTPQISSATTPQQGQAPSAIAAPFQGQAPAATPSQPPQWYGYYPSALAAPAQTAALPKQDGYLQGLAITTIIGSALLIIIGLVGIPFAIIGFINAYFSNGQVSATDFFSSQELYLTAIGACLIGGGLALYHSIRSILKKPSTTVILPSFWIFLIPYVLLLAGLFTIQIVGGEIPLVLMVLLLLALISPLVGFAFTSINLRLLPTSASFITWRRMIVAFISGATAPFLLIRLLNISIDFGVLYAINNCVGANPASYCTNSAFLPTTFILTTIIVVLIQVTITPLLLAFYIRKVQRVGEAALLGLVCGTGFGVMQGAVAVGTSYHDWIGILLTSLGMIILNGTGGALVTLGWYHILNADHRQLLKASGYWLWAVVQQIVFNLLPIAALVPALDTFLKSWKVSLGTGIVSFYEIGYIVGVIIILAVFLYLMQRLRKEETPLLEEAAPSTEAVTSSKEVSSDEPEMSSDVSDV